MADGGDVEMKTAGSMGAAATGYTFEGEGADYGDDIGADIRTEEYGGGSGGGYGGAPYDDGDDSYASVYTQLVPGAQSTADVTRQRRDPHSGARDRGGGGGGAAGGGGGGGGGGDWDGGGQNYGDDGDSGDEDEEAWGLSPIDEPVKGKGGPMASTVRALKRRLVRHKDLFLTVPALVFALLLLGFVVWPYQNLSLEWRGWVALSMLGFLLVTLVSELASPAFLFMLVLVVLMATGVLTVDEAVAGFGNSDVVTIAALYSLAKGIQQSTLLTYAVKYLLGRPGSLYSALLRLCIPVMVLSTMLSSTSIISILAPVVNSWSSSIGIAPSQVFLPLGFSSILGGSWTLIGASANLLVASLASHAADPTELGFFDAAPVGIPVALVGLIYLVIGAKFILPNKKNTGDVESGSIRKYSTAMHLPKGSSADGKTVSEAKLVGIPGVQLFELQRGSQVIALPENDFVLSEGDVLFFSGAIETVLEKLYKVRGISPVASDQASKLSKRANKRVLLTAIVSRDSRLVGRTCTEVRFRQRYGAVILAVHRGGEDVNVPIPEIVFEGGDGLVIEATRAFQTHQDVEQDFVLVSPVGAKMSSVLDTGFPFHAGIALVCILFIAGTSAAKVVPLSLSVIGSVIVMIMCRILTTRQAFGAISLGSLSIIGISLALSTALVNTHVAHNVAATLLAVFRYGGQIGILSGIFFTTALLATLVSPQAAVSLIFPIAYAIPADSDVTQREMLVTLIMAANCSVMTPWSRSSNLMVSESGGYSTKHFLLYGGPLSVIMMVITIPFIYYVPLYIE